MSIIIETCPKCGHDLFDSIICTYPPIPKKECFNCGWSWTGNQKEEDVIRIPFNEINIMPNITTLNPLLQINNENYNRPACLQCGNNPINGGSGICNCILGQPEIT